MRDVIQSTMSSLGWMVEVDTFQTSSVFDEDVTFSNVVATQDPDKPRQLVLSCHYDSKKSPTGFLGATDSAVPCAIILNIATSLDSIIKMQDKESGISLQLVFFDGEEQLYENTLFGPDGLYGSKHMARKLKESSYTSNPGDTVRLGQFPVLVMTTRLGTWCQEGEATEMDRIDLLLLLDLIGAPAPFFENYVDEETGLCNLFSDELSEIENAIVGDVGDDQKYFHDFCWTIDDTVDDHTPFVDQGLRKNLHVISDPFPEVWHTMDDDWEHLEFESISRINRIFRVFVAEYLNLEF